MKNFAFSCTVLFGFNHQVINQLSNLIITRELSKENNSERSGLSIVSNRKEAATRGLLQKQDVLKNFERFTGKKPVSELLF